MRRQSEHFGAYETDLRRLDREGLVYPAFMSRGEIRAHITEQEAAGGDWPRDPDGVPLYPGLDKALSQRKRTALIAEREPFAWRLDMAEALARIGEPLDWTEFSGEGLSRLARSRSARRSMGRRRPCAPRRADQLSSVGGRRRCAARGDPYRARPGPVSPRRRSIACCSNCSACRRRPIITTADPRAGRAKALQERRSTGIAALREQGETPETIRARVGLG